MKRVMALLTSTTLALSLLTGCGAGGTPPATSTSAAASEAAATVAPVDASTATPAAATPVPATATPVPSPSASVAASEEPAAIGSDPVAAFGYVTYENSKVGYSMEIPTFLDQKTENDKGDGAVFSSSTDENASLKVTGLSNTEKLTAKALSDQKKNEVAHITGDQVGEDFYTLDCEGGEVGDDLIVFRFGAYLRGDKIIQFEYKYLASKQPYYDVVFKSMAENVKAK